MASGRRNLSGVSADSNASNKSLADSIREDYLGVAKYILGDADVENLNPEVLLQRMLSTKSAITTNSTLAEKNQEAQDDLTKQIFPCIGQGQCGTIYALLGTPDVIKLPRNPEKLLQLHSDLRVHYGVQAAFEKIPEKMRVSYNINIPKLRFWTVPTNDDFWSVFGAKFPDREKVPNFGLVSERIYPLQLPVRSALVDVFAPKHIKKEKDKFLAEQDNKDCLVRLYLGRRSEGHQPKEMRLRNFPLHVDQMQLLGLDVEVFARAMAQALAILHWSAGIDANDVEFVLGSSPIISPNLTVDTVDNSQMWEGPCITDFRHRTISIWLLDFNQCEKFTKDAQGLQKLVSAFWWNDPYYPRPGDELWDAFASHYLETSGEFEKSTLPKDFLEAVCKEAKKRAGAKSLFG